MILFICRYYCNSLYIHHVDTYIMTIINGLSHDHLSNYKYYGIELNIRSIFLCHYNEEMECNTGK